MKRMKVEEKAFEILNNAEHEVLEVFVALMVQKAGVSPDEWTLVRRMEYTGTGLSIFWTLEKQRDE